MFKRLLLTSILIISSSNTLAENTLYGIAFISQDITQEIKPTSGSSSQVETSGSGIGIYADLFYQNKYRFNVTLSYIGHSAINTDDFNFTSLTASADYLIPIDSSFTFFTGVTAGGASMTFDGSSISDAAFGTLYGAQAGAIILLPANIMLELGYRIRPAQIETDIVDGSGAVTATSSVDELSETYLSLIITF